MNVTPRAAVRMLDACLASILLTVLMAPIPQADAQSEQKLPGCWPQAYSVVQDDAAGLLTLSTPYYAVRQDLKKGGAISGIQYTHGRAHNLLVRAVETWVRDDRGALFTDLNDPAPRVSRGGDPMTVTVAVESRLFDEKGRASGVQVKTLYEYRWGYVKIHKEFLFPPESLRLKELCAFSTTLAPSLSDYGYREGLTEQEGAPPFSFGSCRWGKLRVEPPAAGERSSGAAQASPTADPPLKTAHVPRYLVFVDPGVEGLEWFAASDLSQWDLQLSGRRGQGLFTLEPSQAPPGVALSICPLHHADPPSGSPEGASADTAISLTGTCAFDYYIGVPILEGHAQRPWFHTSFNRNRGDWVSPEQVEGWASAGMQTVHCHNDGDYYGDGLFWRDGSYPPYPDMEKYDKVIEECHRRGIRVATYFSNKELHPSTKEFQDHGSEWGRKDSKGNLQHNFYREKSEFGAQMCLRSGWLEFLKLSIDRVLKNHPLDGVYYDWNVALYCYNALHEPGKTASASAKVASEAPTSIGSGHWDIDELLSLMEWTRRRVGPNGLIIVHNTTTPMFVTENFSNHVVAMEWGYQRWTEGAPRLGQLPVEWSFVGARSRGVISYGHIDAQAPRRLHRLFALEALVSGVTPWPASPETFELFPILKPLGDVEAYRFADWRNRAVTLEDGRCASALYSRPGESYIILANLDKEAREVHCVLRLESLPYPLAAPLSATRLGGDRGSDDSKPGPSAIDAARWTQSGVKFALPPDGAVLVHVRQVR